MLSAEDNELLTRTGPGTPMGRVLRRYWQPLALAAELPDDRPLIDIDAPDKSDTIKIAVRRPTNVVKEKYFDLNWLMSVMPPERVEGECPSRE